MAGEAPGVYMKVGGQVLPAATVPGPPGPEGDPGPTGPDGVYKSPTPPPDPIANQLWLDTSGF